MEPWTWPPPYTLRVSERARNWSLHIKPMGGLEVVVPRRFNLKRIPALLEDQRRWIMRHIAQIIRPSTQTPPTAIALPAIDEAWSIEYRHTSSDRIRVATYKNQRLIVSGHTRSIDHCHTILYKWLQKKGKQHLPPWLDLLSQETGLEYNGLTIRNQQTLWGSCTGNNAINLNCKLLLLEKECARYIMIHELCHTQHHNHSKSFWRLVKRFAPNYKTLCKQLRSIHTERLAI